MTPPTPRGAERRPWRTPALQALQAEVRAFVDSEVIPHEAQLRREDLASEARAADVALGRNGADHGLPTLARIQRAARDAGLWTPHLPAAWGGRGLDGLGMCIAFREMGRSPYGAAAFHCDAPDQGNMDLLLRRGDPEQRDRWLRPLAEGAITSAFCMTEPAPGAGADPRNLRTAASRDGDGYRLDGHKWYATGGGRASLLLVMARTSDDPVRGASIFLVPRDRDGVEHVRDVTTMAEPMLSHREAELRFHGVRLDAADRLGLEGEGFALAQTRLVPARLTHCMRWLGLGARALALCHDHVLTRQSFGQPLASHQLVQQMLASAATALHAGNLMTLDCALQLEGGDERGARAASSMTKTFVARALCQILDDAIQMHGSLGYSDDLPFARWSRFARAARIADGPDEVHVATVARDLLAGRIETLR